MKKYLVMLSLVALTACGGSDVPAEEAKKDEPLAQSANSDAFNESFGNFLNSYYQLKDALVATNDAETATAATAFAGAADSLALDEMKADSSIILTAKDFATTISNDAKAIASATGIEAKRQAFQPVSDNLYTLLQTVRYDKEVVYHQYCPMAFNDQGAFWLSNSTEIMNPYFGKKMLHCGEVKDSLDFRGK